MKYFSVLGNYGQAGIIKSLKFLLSFSINFKDPQFAEDYIFKAVMLPGAR
jgi:5'-3' exoribonuclease 2